MQLSDRFLNLVKLQLNSFEAETAIEHLVVYVANSKDGEAPSLEAVGQYPNSRRALLPVEADPDLRTPSPNRRWYPLQEGSILLGVLRAEHYRSDQIWSDPLDQRLQATSAVLAHSLGLELERARLLEDLSKQREQLSLMVHQLRNPLTALRTYAQLLLRRLGPESNHRNLVEGLLTEQDQLNRYISALDQLSQEKLTANAGNISPLLLPPVLPKNSYRNLRSLLEPLINRAAATANLQSRQWHSPSKWPEWTNKGRLRGDGIIAEIVANLLENAFRYSPQTSAIGIHLNDEGLCVWDGGLSIALEERERIFQKGFRGKSSADISGSGLGLTLGRQLAEQLGGCLQLLTPPERFDSDLPNSGNAFVLTLPAEVLQGKEV